MFALELKNLNKSFSKQVGLFKRKKVEKHVLNNCSLKIEEGKIFGLVGLNGTGKTTMIKIILDLLNADDGEVKIFGKSNLSPTARTRINYLPEKFCPSPYLTGHEFLKISMSFFKKKLNLQEADKVAKSLDLEPKNLKDIVKKYSKGMGQKLGLLACILSDAKLLILDEPMSGLDPKARTLLKQILVDYAKKGNTIFFSSHILSDVEEICDKMAVLNNGKITFCGTPKDFRKTYPAETAEKSFLKALEQADDDKDEKTKTRIATKKKENKNNKNKIKKTSTTKLKPENKKSLKAKK